MNCSPPFVDAQSCPVSSCGIVFGVLPNDNYLRDGGGLDAFDGAVAPLIRRFWKITS